MDGKTPLVSVIMSVYNGEQWLQQAIDSILHQTYTNWEFIIIDDASGQAVKEILASIKDERVKITYNLERQGLTKNLNTAIEQCRGKYIARMDADDISLPDRFQKQVAYLEHYGHLAGSAGWIEFINESGEPAGIWSEERRYCSDKEIANVIARQNIIAHPAVMLRANVLKEYRYNEKQVHSQDWDLWLRLFADGKGIEKLKEVILQYRVHEKSVTAKNKTGSVYKKIDTVYRNYLAAVPSAKRSSTLNRQIRRLYRINKIKLFLSRIKRLFTS